MKLDTHRRLPTSSAQDKAYTMEDLLEIEEWPEHNALHPDFNFCLVKFMACKICLKLRSRTKFCTMFKAYFYARRNALEGSGENVMKCRLKQVCLSCAAATGIYDYMEVDGWYMTKEGGLLANVL